MKEFCRLGLNNNASFVLAGSSGVFDIKKLGWPIAAVNGSLPHAALFLLHCQLHLSLSHLLFTVEM